MSTTASPKVAAIRKQMLAEIKLLKSAVADPNALMAGNPILESLQNLETLRNEYFSAAWEAPQTYCETL